MSGNRKDVWVWHGDNITMPLSIEVYSKSYASKKVQPASSFEDYPPVFRRLDGRTPPLFFVPVNTGRIIKHLEK